jgi:cell wall assembly regulator SMI1
VNRLQPGLAEEQQDRMLAPLELRLPQEARLWWRWHDGVTLVRAPSIQRTIGPGFEYLPLAEAIVQYHRCRDAAREVASTPGQSPPVNNPDHWWAPHWFPVTLTGYGGVVACDCSVDDALRTPIRMVWWAGRESYADPVTQSFGEMVSWWIDAMETGAWHFDTGHGEWQANHDLLADRSRELTRLV